MPTSVPPFRGPTRCTNPPVGAPVGAHGRAPPTTGAPTTPNWYDPIPAILRGAARGLTIWLASVTAVPVGRENDGMNRPSPWGAPRSGTELDRSWGEQVQSLSDALEAWRSNPLARRLISRITAYTIGDGICTVFIHRHPGYSGTW